ncbi:hypothetical protein VTK73DRAFT_3791 [Phialemonium thermophilum]|uniref:Zn(2)-C6 fungal-type domain-containing protein n=1 Tax=Phialemonium thermophilum TaxID=223376 RepID=A0ABR3WXH2_9PEZI
MERTPGQLMPLHSPPIPVRMTTVGGENDEGSLTPDDLPACQSCRRRKLKCSRELPACSQCLRHARECLYPARQKPGVKAGAVESLSRRLDLLEQLLLDDTGKRKEQLAFLDDERGTFQGSLPAANSLDAGSPLQPQPSDQPQTQPQPQPRETEDAHSRYCRAEGPYGTSTTTELGGPRKRRRTFEIAPDEICGAQDDESDPPLPPLHLLEPLVEAHFRTVHHWVPILHETRFRAKVRDPSQRSELAVLLNALVVASVKFVSPEDLRGFTKEGIRRQICESRKLVLLHAMESLSVENTQALIFLAFDHMGSGNLSRAWPIIGSLTRMVEYLQLTLEPPDASSQKQLLLRPLTLVERPKNWTESEERRRIFWSVFLLDRACSVTSGWHTSLTSDDVHRRLPCSGGMWAREEPVSTPFFGIWDKSTAKIGNPIATAAPTLYGPPTPRAPDHAHYASPGSSSGAGGVNGNHQVDTSKLGAFAYCIEATENLSQITSFFLQQSVDFEDRDEVRNWLMRFKELDLRLVHWKKFLPQQWQDSNVSRDVSVIKMDPNLTLAHMTHNAATILLHQHIAYPPAAWRDVVKLPSACSAETCQLAAVEISSIARNYLRYMGGTINSQFAFCAFVAARVLLVQWRHGGDAPLAPEFFELIENLKEMSRRWDGYFDDKREREGIRDDAHIDRFGRRRGLNLMSRYAAKLEYARERYLGGTNANDFPGDALLDASLDGLLDINQRQFNGASGDLVSPQGTLLTQGVLRSDFAPFIAPLGSSSGAVNLPRPPIGYNSQGTPVTSPEAGSPHYQQQHHGNRNNHHLQNQYHHQQHHQQQQHQQQLQQLQPQDPSTAAAIALSSMVGASPRAGPATGHQNGNRNHSVAELDELSAMSHILLGGQFMDMDRVITLDGTDFWDDAGLATRYIPG